MTDLLDTIETALLEIEGARTRISKIRSVQITQGDVRDYLKSVAFAWFKSHRPKLTGQLPDTTVRSVDEQLQRVLDATDKASARTTYVAAIKEAKGALTALRTEALVMPLRDEGTIEPAPDFTPSASDSTMRDILVRRWEECQRCLMAGAHLAATVMMGGLLEALFVARANQLSDEGPLFKAKACPIDRKTKNPMALGEWTLRPYIDVGEELGWITHAGKDVAAVLRDYRNYIHPEKERSHGVTLNSHDSNMFWLVTKNLTRQLLEIGAERKKSARA